MYLGRNTEIDLGRIICLTKAWYDYQDGETRQEIQACHYELEKGHVPQYIITLIWILDLLDLLLATSC